MNIKEIRSKTILSASKIYTYVINPYVGCQHGCHYCYARFIKRFSGHQEPWGEFVDIKINAAKLLPGEIKKKKRAKIWISGLCDPYQPLEAKYTLTRKVLEILIQNEWPVVIQTRSPLVLRDLDVFKGAENFEVGFSITTADDEIRKLFEPDAPSIKERIRALDELHQSGIRTYAMIAPLLPGAETLVNELKGKVDYIIVDRMNYNYAGWIYRKHHLEDKLTDNYFEMAGREIANNCLKSGIVCKLVF
jgi:DNA repair photolyase